MSEKVFVLVGQLIAALVLFIAAVLIANAIKPQSSRPCQCPTFVVGPEVHAPDKPEELPAPPAEPTPAECACGKKCECESCKCLLVKPKCCKETQ